MKTQQQKQLLIEQLQKTPIVQFACEKTGIVRATYYRWRGEDLEFAKQADAALGEGALLVNDLAESQIISAIKDRNITAIIYWLRHHHPSYTNRLELVASLKQEELTPEQEAAVREALRLSALLPEESETTSVNQEEHDHRSNAAS